MGRPEALGRLKTAFLSEFPETAQNAVSIIRGDFRPFRHNPCIFNDLRRSKIPNISRFVVDTGEPIVYSMGVEIGNPNEPAGLPEKETK